MAWSSEAERYTILDKVAEAIAGIGEEPITREALALLLAQRVFPEPKLDYEVRRRARFIQNCLVNG